MIDDLYQEQILEHLNNPCCFGRFDSPDLELHERNASCGDEVSVTLRRQETEQADSPLELLWQGSGCAISMASMSLLAEKISTEKLSPSDIRALQSADVLELLGLEEISIGRVKCMELGLRAVQTAVQQLIAQ